MCHQLPTQFSEAAKEFTLINPNTKTCPIFRNKSDAELAKVIYRRVPPLCLHKESQEWPPRPLTAFNMANDSYLFVTTSSLRERGARIEFGSAELDGSVYLPLYEAKMFWHFDHRWSSFCGDDSSDVDVASKEESSFTALPRYWLPKHEVDQRFKNWSKLWQIGYRRVTGSTNERTAVVSFFPYTGAGHTITLLRHTSAENGCLLVASASSFVFDYACRQKVSGTDLTITVFEQLPFISPESCSSDWMKFISSRVLELTYTAWDLEAFAADCGWSGPPFRWDEERRFLLRCELDSAFFHLYLGPQTEWQQQPEALTRAFPTPRHAVSYIMDTFPIVKRKDEAKHGHYRTKETIIQIYDALAEAMQTGVAYQPLLSPPPADAACCHPPRT